MVSNIPAISLNTYPTKTNPTTSNEQASNQELHKNNDEIKEYSANKIGSASTRVARKGIKYAWKKLCNWVSKVIKGDKKAREEAKEAFEIVNNAHKVVEIYDDFNSEPGAPVYNYNA